jgi:tryptophanyl-tRNA synthetase
MLANAHSFKDKSSKLNDVNAGLFTYPVLMAADILLYDSDVVPVGKDQVQHLEITRDIAKSFNSRIQEVFIIPKAKIYKNEVVIGTDGQKMSKSYKNTIDVFAVEKTLKKQIMSIKTDSTPLDEPKDYKNCNIFKLYDQLSDDSSKLKQSYINGTIGFGDAKKQLLELVLKKFAKAREHFNNFLNNKPELIKILEAGEVRASKIAKNKLKQVKKALYS